MVDMDRPAKNVKCAVRTCRTVAETFIGFGKDRVPVCGIHAALYRAQRTGKK